MEKKGQVQEILCAKIEHDSLMAKEKKGKGVDRPYFVHSSVDQHVEPLLKTARIIVSAIFSSVLWLLASSEKKNVAQPCQLYFKAPQAAFSVLFLFFCSLILTSTY